MPSKLQTYLLFSLIIITALLSNRTAYAQEDIEQLPGQMEGVNSLFMPLVPSNNQIDYPDAPAPQPIDDGLPIHTWPEGTEFIPLPEGNWEPSPEGEAVVSSLVVSYDPATGKEIQLPPPSASATASGLMATADVGREALPSPYASMTATVAAIESSMAPDTFGNLARVANPQDDPWRRAVKIFITYSGNPGTIYSCSGALFKPSWVMTSGGCVFNKTQNYGWATSIKVVPAYENGQEPFGASFASNFYTFDAWIDSTDYAYNIGWFQLDRPIGAVTGSFGYGAEPTDSFFTNYNFDSPGYPGSNGFNGESMYNRTGKFDTVGTDNLVHNGYTSYAGYGGAPAYRAASDGSPNIIFGVRYGSIGTNTAYVRITNSKLESIRDTITAGTPAQADLIPLTVQLSASTVTAGSQISSYSYMLHNNGRAAWSGTVRVKVYLSTNSTISTGDTLLQEVANSRSLAALDSSWYTGSALTIPGTVSAGTYYIGIIIEATDSNSANNIVTTYDVGQITVNSPPPSVLNVSPTSLQDFNSVAGGSVPASQRLTISFDGVLQPTWTATENAEWLSLSPTSGTGSGTVDVIINTSGLAPGGYESEITISAPGASTSSTPKKIAVKLNLTPATLQLSPSPLLLNGLLGSSQPVTGLVTLTFAGGASPGWGASANAEWLDVLPNEGTGNSQITVVANPQGLSEGVYSGNVLINWTQDGQNAVQTLPVSLTVGYGSGTLIAAPTSLSFSALANGENPPAQPLALTGGGRAWVATTNQPWLLLDHSVGNLPDTIMVQPDIGGLAAGQYTADIVLSSGENLSTIVKVSLTVGDKGVPLLQIQPSQLRFEGIIGQVAPAAADVSLVNLGGGTMAWTVATSHPWLTVDKREGQGKSSLRVGVKLDGLTAGNYAGQVTISAPNAQGSPQVLTVALRVQKPPTLAVDGSQLVFVGIAGETTLTPQDFVVRNGGSGTLAWQASEDIAWLALDKSQGNAPSQVRVTINPAGLTPGSYSGVITVVGKDAAASPRQIQVKLYLAPGPVLALTPPTLYLDVEAGTTKTYELVDVKNARQGKLQWTASEAIEWLTLGSSQGTVDAFGRQPLAVTVNATGLTPRETPYTGQIVVASTNGDASPQTIQVKLSVYSKARYCRISNGSSDYILNTSQIKMWMENVQVKPSATGCDLSAKVRVTLPQNTNLTFDISGKVDENNNLTASAGINLDLGIAEVHLLMTKGITINDLDGIVASGGAWQFSKKFGGKRVDFNEQIRIGPNGITLAGNKAFALPNLDWGGFKLVDNQGSISGASDGTFLFQLSGTMQIEVGGAGSSTRMTVVLDQRGIRRSEIADFTITGLAGLDFQVQGGKMSDDRISAASARLRVPKEWGGGEVAVYQLVIFNDGKITIGGGRFRLPDLAVGGDAFKLASLEGEFESVKGGGYRIRAMGAFGMTGISDVGDCRMWIDVVLQTGANGARLLTLNAPDVTQTFIAQPGGGVTMMNLPTSGEAAAAANPDSLDALRLERLTVGVRCTPGWAIGTTGFFLTGVEGTIELSTKLEKISVKVWIESGIRAGSIAAISAVPQLTIRPKPFEMDYEATTYVLRIPAEKTKVHLDRRSFSAEFTYNYIIVRASMGVAAGLNGSGDFFLRGSGRADVGLEKGSLLQECISYPAPTWKNPGRKLTSCINIPDSNIWIGGADAAIDLQGMDISVGVMGVRGTARWDFGSGTLSFRKGMVSASISSADVMVARQQWEAAQSGAASISAIDARFEFDPEGDLTFAIPVALSLGQSTDQAAIANEVTPFTNTVQSDAVFALAQPSDGPLLMRLIDPAGNEIDPEHLPSHVQYFQTVTISGTEMVYTVRAAQPGNWKVKVVGDTVNNGFFITHAFNSPPPAFGQAKVEAMAGEVEKRKISWQLLAAEPGTRVSIYANPGPLTQTATYTNVAGQPVSTVVERFAGIPVASGLTSLLNGSLQLHTLDLTQLPTGNYILWLEASGAEGVATRCYIRADGLDCNRTGQPPARLVIDRGASFPATWKPAFDVVTNIKRGEITLGWTPIAHQDVDEYLVQVKTTDSLSPTVEIVREFSVGTSTNNGLVSTILSNIEPGHSYALRVQAKDVESGRTVWSDPQTITTPQPDFVVTGPTIPVQIGVGKAPQPVALTVSLSSELPYPVVLDIDQDRLADGLYVDVANELVSIAVAESMDTSVVLEISTSSTLDPGTYVVPVNATSGRLRHQINIRVDVQEQGTTSGHSVHLPLIVD